MAVELFERNRVAIKKDKIKNRSNKDGPYLAIKSHNMVLISKISDEYERPTIFIRVRLAATVLYQMYIPTMMNALTNTMINSTKILTLAASLIIR